MYKELLDVFYRGLPKVSPEDNATLEGPLVLEELQATLNSMAGGKSPGIDGLPAEFYKFFWQELREDLLEVLNESCREMSIIDNVSLIRDILDISSSLAVDFGLISLDQEKAFDRVEHQYLWRTLEAFGLSPSLIAMMKVMYQDAESLLKTNGGLSSPSKVKRGIRQGCSSSVDAGMAAAPAQGTPTLSLRNGCRCVPEPSVSVEMLEVVTEQVGFDNILSASRMNKAIVVFLKSESLVNQVSVDGIWGRGAHVTVTPLSTPATRITVSNVPPFRP
ncbi:hypothetical protein QTP86_023918 [Hemibagrus guttatus]|nr:hypothetical protein QTP86_023918 [Hemibagrus guttatus]